MHHFSAIEKSYGKQRQCSRGMGAEQADRGVTHFMWWTM